MRGLSTEEAGKRLSQGGYNELVSAGPRTVPLIAREVIREPMFILLILAGSIYLLLGDPGDAAMLLGFVVMSMAITIYQERKAERVLEALRSLSSPRALVIRDGEQLRIPGREVVRGDLLVLQEGDRIAADGSLLACSGLLVDESLLTGESHAVPKHAGQIPHSGAGASGETETRVYSGSMIMQGSGLASVTATGGQTRLGAIGRSVQQIAPEKSPLVHEIDGLVKRFSLIGAGISLLVFIIFGLARGEWMNGLLAGITLAMSVLPEEFTLILAVFTALGAWRISRNRVLTRHTPVIEALGSATVLCVDKTGTLTENRMSVHSIAFDDQLVDFAPAGPALPQPACEVIRYAALASEPAPFDPMEKAIQAAMAQLGPDARRDTLGPAPVRQYPLSGAMRAMAQAWKAAGTPGHVVAAKGAPETVVRLCALDQGRAERILAQVDRLAAQGMRVLGVACASHGDRQAWPAVQTGFRFEWLGLVGLADPIRPSVPNAVRECHTAGIRVVMITGDFPATAQAIAREAGLRHEQAVTGAQLDALTDAGVRDAIRAVHVFARILPEQKLRLVRAFKAMGDVVAMTGDGVNDAPALKAAHIGIAMGGRGTDVAREAASLVLLDDDFTSIVRTIRLGRRIYANLRKALTYVVAVHIPIAGMTLLPLVSGTPLVFAPVHIVFLEMIINPACAIVFEAEKAEEDIMLRPPRAIGERLFGPASVLHALLQGGGLFAAVAGVFFIGLWAGFEIGRLRAIVFSCVVAGNLALIVANRSSLHSIFELVRVPNRAQWWIAGSACLALGVILWIEPLRRVFHFAPVLPSDIMFPVLAAVLLVAWSEALKRWFRPRRPA